MKAMEIAHRGRHLRGMENQSKKSAGFRLREIFSALAGRDMADEVASIESAMARLEAERVAAQAELATLAEQRVQALLDDDDARCDRLDRRGEMLHRTCERVEVALPELQRRLDDARRRGDEAARLATYNAAKEARRAAESALRKYSDAAKQIVDILEAVARADSAVAAANAALPEGQAALAFAEQVVRGDVPEHDEILDETDEEVWEHVSTGWKVDPDDVAKIVEARAGSRGSYETSVHNVGLTTYEVVKRRYRTTRILQARSADRVEPLSTQIVLPRLAFGDDRPFWKPTGVGALYGPPDGKAVLAAVADLRTHWSDKPKERPERSIVTSRRLVEGEA
jgi:hypothetical protein